MKTVTKKVTVSLEVPVDYFPDEDECEYIEVLIALAGERGSGLEDLIAARETQCEHQGAVRGAGAAQQAAQDLSGQAFARGRDEEAKAIRDLASKLDATILTLEDASRRHRELFFDERVRAQLERRKNGSQE